MYERSNSKPSSGSHESVWLATTPTTEYGRLDGGLDVDTAVIGGGIAGITTAAKLREAGQSVALLERDRILTAVTGHTTAKLTSLHGMPYSHVEKHFGEDGARLYAEANESAIDDIEETVDESGIDCAFSRRPACTYVTEPDRVERVREEVSAANRAGLDASFVTETELPVPVAGDIEVADQASFHPRQYLLELARRIPGDGGHLLEETTVTDVDDGDPCEVETDRGTVHATDVVVASHFPIVDEALYFSRLRPKRSYVIAVRLDGDQPEGMYYCPEEPYFSVRSYTHDGDRLVLFGGQNHRTGQGATTERYRDLEREVRKWFDVESVEYYWSTQDFVSPDRVPFIGPLAPQTDNLYVATGFGGWGMTGGTVAGMLLRDLILGRDNEWADLFTPSRVKPRASAGEFAAHNTHAVRHMVSDFLSRDPSFDASSLSAGEADVFDVDGHSVGIYRDDAGDLHAVSATCTHMGCQVTWNDAEHSWDCPCHGSRFDVDGSVLDTPAVEDLDQYTVRERRLDDADRPDSSQERPEQR
jgi:glycine/D-amino acid oxidase-like deaminating enzyme/nitrite reductase/ring-hydroxylating ferredoxin subunit